MTLLETGLLVVLDVSLGMWLGAMVFFSFIGAPTTFDVLDTDAGPVVNRAGRFLARCTPRASRVRGKRRSTLAHRLSVG
ncbi:DUF4149 domain-containing protein [Haladaptatus caseinilyticus]|uniref:DUF4149 domain-containing protein n=1 Tax=Haladaptatus caseinilyticus TaxID=2993314 RepID=UPI002E229B13